MADPFTQNMPPVLRLMREVNDGITRNILICHCGCGATDRRTMTKKLPTDGLLQMFRSRGWSIDGRGKTAICPTCQAEEREMAPSPDALRKQRELYALLDAHYDENAKAYVPGWTDQRVAKEVGLSLEAVASVRDAVYGPAEPPELVKAVALVDALRTELQGQAQTLHKLIGELEVETKRKISEIEGLLAKRRAA